MGDETPRTTRDPLAVPKCPGCGSALAILATRHKVLGAWVPEWQVQPCRNPDCPLYEAVESDGTEATTTQVTGKNGENGRSPATG
ncbi:MULTISPECIES: hypothetical protein [Streptomyces]|uniref:hypothetical protein n=1 Tax=Streptomyces TaxID=1883 RepID=UPI0005BB4C9F|nr:MULTISPECIES: hypothetical protein [Streptomyces]